MLFPNRPKRRARRKGLALVAVLVFAIVILMLLTSMSKALTHDQRQNRDAQKKLQTFWLVESAVQRSVHSIEESPDYAGEAWDVPADAFGTGDSASVVIQVKKEGDSSASRRVRIEARYPSHPVHSVLESREFVVELPQ
jgi:type II secretory pathway component PulK